MNVVDSTALYEILSLHCFGYNRLADAAADVCVCAYACMCSKAHSEVLA